MKRSTLLIGLAVLVAGAAALQFSGHGLDLSAIGAARKAAETPMTPAALPSISVARVSEASFTETVVLPGTLVAREEVLIAPEVEGLRIVEIKVDEGQTVQKGAVLAVLETATLDAQMAQNDASLARNAAAIAQARSSIAQAEARLEEAANSLTRAKPLRQSGTISESTFEQRDAAAKTAQAQLASSHDGLKLSEAEKAQTEAQRRELTWKRSRTEVRAPVDGIISRRNARIGGMATSVGDPMFRLIAKGEIELDAEVPEQHLVRLKTGQKAEITIAGLGETTGAVRLISPEIDKTSRLGRVRILVDRMASPRVGSFGKGTVVTAASRGLAIPSSAVQFGDGGGQVLIVIDNRVVVRKVKAGLQSGGMVEILEGLAVGDLVVARAGTFLREGDIIRPVTIGDKKLSEVN